MRYKLPDIGGKVVKEDDRYIVKDNDFLKNLILSSTELNPGKQTSGHRHAGQEEVYIFVNGSGNMIVDGDSYDQFDVTAGDVILIPDGAFHQVINTSNENLYFVCIFDGNRNH